MLDVRYVVSIVLLLVEGLWKIIRSGCTYEALEEQVQVLSQKAATMLFVWTLEKMDNEILKTRDVDRYECRRFEPRTGIAIFGEFTINRRLYRDRKTGEPHFLLDEALGWPPYERLFPKMKELALDLGTEMPFRRAARIISQLVPGISAMTAWRVAKQAGEAVRREDEARRKELYEDGVIPDGRHSARVLFLEADGVMVSQQRSTNRKAEVKLLTAYDGKRGAGNNRRVLEHRLSVAATQESKTFWETANARLLQQWKLDEIERVELGGDGASWVKEGDELFPNTTYHLDRFHLRKSLTEALAFDAAGYQAAVTAIARQDQAALASVLDRTARATRDTQRKRIRDLKGYLLENWDGIVAQRPEGGLGVIEGQVRHTITRRMKRIGARWSPEGTDRMARLLAARANHDLDRYLADYPEPESVLPLAEAVGETPIDRSRTCGVEDLQEWLRVRVPALDTPSLTGCYLREIINAVTELI
jgi:hypothetical protein